MSKNTAVEWLVTELRNRIAEGTLDAIAISKLKMQAKAMEREQIIDAFDEGQEYEYQYHVNGTPKFDSETYFIETYKGGEQ